MTDMTGHLLVFTAVAVVFLLLPLLIGKLLRPRLPTPEKDAVYECGEPTIGSSYIQFDLRFYVVALLFIVFDVEVAFFFPWATVFGGAAQLADPRVGANPAYPYVRENLTRELLSLPANAPVEPISAQAALGLTTFALYDILVFFGVLLVGFAYLWKRGDIDWVRALAQESKKAAVHPRPPATATAAAPAPSGSLVGASH